MSSPPKSSSVSPSRRLHTSSSVHQKLTSVINSSTKPFIKSKSQTTSSIAFPAFRFSPESEEIQEVIIGGPGPSTSSSFVGTEESGKDKGSDNNMEDHSLSESHAQSTNSSSSSSSTKSGGDVSPLKEYILKHKWANKWDKRSLSLDLDLKGKIFTALEDKRKSFVSQFLNEEEEDLTINQPAIVQSCSIPDQLVGGLENSGSAQDLSENEQDLSVHSDTVLMRGNGISASSMKYNLFEENCTDYFYDDEYEVVDEMSLNPNDYKNLVVEEIGVDCCDDSSGMAMRESLGLLKEFVLAPDALAERFEGSVALYNPPGSVWGLRKFPIQMVQEEEETKPEKAEVETVSAIPETKDPNDDASAYRLSGLLRSILEDLIYHSWVKYLVGLFAILVVLDFHRWFGYIVWFFIGIGVSSIVSNALWKEKEEEEEKRQKSVAIDNQIVKNQESSFLAKQRKSWITKDSISQGWVLMLQTSVTNHEPYPVYDPFKTHLRDMKPVFVRLTGKYLTISTPHPRHRIPKRRLWSDAPPSTDFVFVRHQQYDLTNATITIAPEGLAKKRVWCKKYPISITFNVDDKYCGKLLSGDGSGNGSENHSPTTDDSNNLDGKVSFSKDSESVNVATTAAKVEEPKGEVFKETEGCAGKTIYLFCRCDREKDDWLRLLVSATKLNELSVSSSTEDVTNMSHFTNFMKHSCPSLSANSTSRIATPTNDAENQQPSASSGSPPSSLKSSPVDSPLNFIPNELVNPTFLNALIARLFYDFLNSDKWNDKVKNVIDRKLFYIRKPAFVQSLKVKSLEFGDTLPIINHASLPVLDQQGLWIDLDVKFSGRIVITLEAFINLMKIGSGEHTTARVYSDLTRSAERLQMQQQTGENGTGCGEQGDQSRTSSHHAMFNDDCDDSGESSESDEEVIEEVEVTKPPSNTLNERRQKLLKYADTFAKSSVMRNKHVQKVVTGIATTPLLLTVEIKKVDGCVAVNIPPVPNDRVWLGFRTNPTIDINVRPKVGERVVSLSHVTSWIKKKILLEFERVMVCPNLLDVTVPLMEFNLPK